MDVECLCVLARIDRLVKPVLVVVSVCLCTRLYSSGQKKVPVPFRYCERTTLINVRVS